jgi:hypothetical protein
MLNAHAREAGTGRLLIRHLRSARVTEGERFLADRSRNAGLAKAFL